MKGIHTPEELGEVFTTLSQHFDSPLSLSIEGSAAMLYYGSDLPAGEVIVNDWDITDAEVNRFEEAAIATAQDHRLPPGWLNYLNRGKDQTFDYTQPVHNSNGLTVYIPTPAAMLADRIGDGTPYGANRIESLALCKHLNVSSRDDIRNTYLAHTKDHSPGDQLEEAVEQLADDLNTQRLKQRSAARTDDAMQV